MKILAANKVAAQGDILIIGGVRLPPEALPKKAGPEGHIVAHSETGHHHVVTAGDVGFYTMPADLLTSYVEVRSESAELRHLRDYDTHETIQLLKGTYKIKHQQEETPDGWKIVQD